MALAGIWAMCVEINSSGKLQTGITSSRTTKKNYFRDRTSGMEFEADWTKHRKPSAFTSQLIRSATSFMPWSRKIPMSEGYHEFL
ncbi:unnamed protein product [Ilex paraguariensis]|uniref:Uncharacterized protein n=1 Tax=Ilex paraguariensis TaxID=185542 RepID=A0ABC8QX57_9AQUA